MITNIHFYLSLFELGFVHSQMNEYWLVQRHSRARTTCDGKNMACPWHNTGKNAFVPHHFNPPFWPYYFDILMLPF